ncbi:putative efflux protein, MATE family [Hoeflea phototrophica DFL-43]|uniref:Multidrug-efflux transporter n=1 Tax=Hoeflea phototrophica (strain DSM 17068 / NCIMB 14078 / DFL-43) TaxID=411684 RepID=A9DE93_HOEPD|nr:MATE family efflux transporter [Hoeflea phototrophica]EDQ31990.1 putative efflux protein, MATE family [Hoeflea phototrophica DFL-43]
MASGALGTADGQSWGAHARATLALGLPLVGTQIAQIAITTTDVVMLGWYGTEELAATVLASQAFFVVFIFGIGFSSAVLPLAAQAEGRNDPTHVRRSVRMGMWILLLFSALVMPLLWYLEPVLVALGQKPEIAALAGDYIRIAQWGMFPALMMMALRSFFAARSRAGIVLWSALIGTLVNGVLNYLLIFGHFGAPEMGVRGAAVASVISSTVIFLIMAGWALFHRAHRDYRLFQRFWRPEWPAFFEVFRLGLPIGFTILAEAGLFMAASLMMGWLGTVQLAAHGIAIQLASISFMIPLGLSHAATVRVGQAYGRGDRVSLARAAHTVMGLAVVISFAAGLLFWLVPEALIGLFIDETNVDAADLLAAAVPLLLVAGAFQMVDAIQVIGAGLLRGLKDTRIPMYVAMISYWPIGLSTAYGLGFGLDLGGPGIWAGLAIGLGVAAVLLNVRFARRERFLDVKG